MRGSTGNGKGPDPARPPVPRGTRSRGPLAEPSVQIVGLLREGLDDLGLRAGDLAARLASLVELVFSWSVRINLTGHRDRESIARGLVLDALGLASLIPDAPSLVDLGSGAGFPGLPIALARPACCVTLVESRTRRHHFQRAAIRQLRIANATASLGRAEALEAVPHRVAVARAVGPPEELVPWLLRWLEPGGLALVPIRSGSRPPHLPGVSTLGVRSYRVLGGPERRVWVGSKGAARRP